MPRVARLKLNNTVSHIFNRGNQKQIVFRDNDDYETFLSITAHYKLKYGFRIYHQCFMPNHFHFECEFEDAKVMPKAMKEITLTYTRAYHKKYKTEGYLWQGRYKNMIVEKDKYAERLGAYIERNPVRAGLVSDPGQWKWSSYRFYAYGEPLRVLTTNMKGEQIWTNLIDEDYFYTNSGRTLEERQHYYREFIASFDDTIFKKEFKFQNGGVIGGEDFRRILKNQGIDFRNNWRGRPKKR